MSEDGGGDFGDGGFGGGLGDVGSSNDDGGGRQSEGTFGNYPGEEGSHSQAGVTGFLGGGGDDGGGASSWLPAAAVIGGAAVGAAGVHAGYEEMKRRRDEHERQWQSRFDDHEGKRWRWERERWGHSEEGAEASTTAGYPPGYPHRAFRGGTAGGTAGGLAGGEAGVPYVCLDEVLRRERLRHEHHDDVAVDGSDATWGSHPPLMQNHHPDPIAVRRNRCVSLGFLAGVLVFVVIIFVSQNAETEYELGMHESRLFTALPLFTDSIEVKKAGRIRSAAGVMVYGLKKEPKLKRAKPWHADLKDIVVLPNQYRSWAYRLYAKSKIVVHYSIEGAAGITFVILRGEEALHDWKESPLRYQAYEYQTFLHGKGRAPDLGEDPFTAAADGDYFFVFGNLQRSRIKMNVTFVVESLVYDIPGDADDDDEVTTCDLRKHGRCSVYMPLFSRRYAVVATPDSFMGASVWHVTVSYGNRWRAYFLSVGVVLLVLLCTMACMKKRLQYQYDGYEEVRPGSPHAHFPGGSQNASGQDIDGGLHPDYSVGPWRPISSPPPPPPPLLAPQYSPFQMPSPEVPPGAPSGAGTAFPMPSFPYQDPANPNVSRDHMPHGYVAEGEATSAGDLAPSAPPMEKEPWNKDEKAAEKEKGTVTKPRHLRLENPCAVCFDAPKDAIFDPCGHRATCHGCAVRLQESKTAQCPICRVQINQVIKVFDT